MSSKARPKRLSTPVPVTGKRSKPLESSSDFPSSGPLAGKRPTKRLRSELSDHARQPLAEKSTNVRSTQEAPRSEQPTHLEVPVDDQSCSQTERQKEEPQGSFHRSFQEWKHSVLEALERQLDADDFRNLASARNLKWPQIVADIISKRGWWTPWLLESFAETAISELSLSRSIPPSTSPAPFLQRLFEQGMFSELSQLNLAGIPLSLHDISLLRLLPQLTVLNISSTQATTSHLLHLATHAETLCELDISGNPLIDDDCRVPLTALTRLRALCLRGTAVTVPCLRLLVYALSPECRFITIPQPCLDYFNSREKRYCVAIPADYVSDPRQVAGLSMSALKRNLELHKQANKDIMLTGTRIDLVERLKGILCARVADGRIIRRVGKG